MQLVLTKQSELNWLLEIKRWVLFILFWVGFRLTNQLIMAATLPQVLKEVLSIWADLLYPLVFLFNYPRLSGMNRKELGLHCSMDFKTFRQWIIFFIIVMGLIAQLFMKVDFHLIIEKGLSQWLLACKYIYVTIPEEILFRGILCTLVARRFGWFIAIFASAAVFTFDHYTLSPPKSGDITFPFGLLMAWIFYETRTIFFPILFHFSFNVLTVLAGFIFGTVN